MKKKVPETQGELLPVVHEGTPKQRARLRKFGRVNPERIYLAHWKARNRRWPGYLNWILGPGDHPVVVSRRDAQVAASIIQWLGTNVGGGLVKTCEEEIHKARRKDDDERLIAFERRRWEEEKKAADAELAAMKARRASRPVAFKGRRLT